MTTLDERLDNIGQEASKIIGGQNAYKMAAWVTMFFLVIASFFISLGSAKFDFNKVLEAQFWLDFSITFFGGNIAKFAFGKWGDADGHKNKEVIQAINDVNNDNIQIKEKGLVERLKLWVEKNNNERKLRAIKRKTYKKLNSAGFFGIFVNRKKWKSIKNCVLTVEAINKSKDLEAIENLKKELEEKNFDLEVFPIKYRRLKEAELETGLATSAKDDDNLSYSEFYQLFGKNFILTVIMFLLTVLMAITVPFLYDLSWTVLYVFISRLVTFISNAYFGYSIGKSGVEKVKLSILRVIHRFLSLFLEINKEVI